MPVDTVFAVLQAMDCHPTSGRTLTQGCLALGNIGRAGECSYMDSHMTQLGATWLNREPMIQ